ncbi:hypothetical protein [Patulibacter americanus]|uniref:hypothetical protein n=1 Tax=Patulibacter americanus TaxID=588672 RepID=UPI0003B4E01C|nr:hypothetical protein [Patulibacter americanus]
MVPRVTRPWILLACVLALGGCGEGDPTAFASATQRTCLEVGKASSALQDDLVRRDGPSAGRAMADAVDAYVVRVKAATDRLAAVRPPAADAPFEHGTVAALRAHVATMERAASAARRGTLSGPLAAELRTGAATHVPEVPEAVLADAPACRTAAR